MKGSNVCPFFCSNDGSEAFGVVPMPVGENTYAEDSSVSVNASTVNGYIFEEWTGDEVSSEPSIQIFMDDDRNVTANFGNDLSDEDSDGLTALQEYITYGTNPEKPDSDGDGIGDGDEIVTIFNPTGDDTATLQFLAAKPQLYLDLTAPELSQLVAFDEVVIRENEKGDFVITIQLLTSGDLATFLSPPTRSSPICPSSDSHTQAAFSILRNTVHTQGDQSRTSFSD